MTVTRAFRFKLAGTALQEEAFRQSAGAVRLVYNLALQQRREHWRAYRRLTGFAISYASQCRELTDLRAEYDWIGSVPQTCQQQALRDLDKAYSNFFSGRAGYPSPRRRGLNDSFRFHGREVRIERLNRNWGRVRLPKFGWVRFRWTRTVCGTVKNVTISLDPLGWHISFACEVEHDVPANDNRPSVGIDRGVVHALALSDGSFADMPIERVRMLDRRARKQARKLARCKRGSNRWARARSQLSATKSKAARIRRHFNHVQSCRIAKAYGTVVIEALAIANMTRSARGTVEQPGCNVRAKAGLNRAILEQGWHQFATFLAYKIESAGGFLVSVPAAFTSQTCSACGSVSKHHRESQAVFQCSDCGQSAQADTNAAINILMAGTRPAGVKCEVAPLARESRKAS